MRTIHQTAIAIFVGLLPASFAVAQVRVETPPGTGGAVLVQGARTNVEAGPGGANVNVAPGTAAAIQDNAAARQENRIERRQDRRANGAVNNNWRMRNYNNRWWYWNPNNTWSYHNGTAWVPYTATNRSYTANRPARRYSSGYRGNMIQTTPPAVGAGVNTNTNVLPENRALPDNRAVPGNQPATNPAPNVGPTNAAPNNTAPSAAPAPNTNRDNQPAGQSGTTGENRERGA